MMHLYDLKVWKSDLNHIMFIVCVESVDCGPVSLQY